MSYAKSSAHLTKRIPLDTSDSLIFTPQSQTVAKKQAEIARLKQLENKAQTAIKVVIGGAVLSYAIDILPLL